MGNGNGTHYQLKKVQNQGWAALSANGRKAPVNTP